MGVAYECRMCGKQFLEDWIGPCPNPKCRRYCNNRRVHTDDPRAKRAIVDDDSVLPLQDAIDQADDDGGAERIVTGCVGLDHVLAGHDPEKEKGFVLGSLILLCGDPGVGKTQLLLGAFRSMAMKKHDVLYVTAEESVRQIAQRCRRFGKFPSRFQIARKKELDDILEAIEEHKPRAAAIDSIQVMDVDRDLDPGSARSIKDGIEKLHEFTEREQITIFVIGHVNKDSAISGPRALEHLVDASIYLSGNPNGTERTLRCGSKNRFGPTPRAAKFQMTEKGLIDLGPVDPFPRAEKAKRGTPKQSRIVAPAVSAPPEPASDPVSSWTGPRGMTAATVLRVSCSEPECHGKVDRACTAENGAREVGFHPSRINKARGKTVLSIVATPADELPPDPPPRPLGGPPRMRPKKSTPRPRAGA